MSADRMAFLIGGFVSNLLVALALGQIAAIRPVQYQAWMSSAPPYGPWIAQAIIFIIGGVFATLIVTSAD